MHIACVPILRACSCVYACEFAMTASFLVLARGISIEAEREAAALELLVRRTERMRELYTTERAQFQMELASLGLTITDYTQKGAPYC